MAGQDRKILDLLTEIKELLEPISSLSREQFLRDKVQLLKDTITPKNKEILPLLFDPRNLSQDRIAQEAGVSQATVSRFISELKRRNLITEEKDKGFHTKYVDIWNLLTYLENENEQ